MLALSELLPVQPSAAVIDSARVDAGLAAYIASIDLPDNWLDRALEYATTDKAAKRQDAERASLRVKLEQLQRLVIDGDIDQAMYRAEKMAVEAQLAALVHE